LHVSDARNKAWRLGLLAIGLPSHLLLAAVMTDPDGLLGPPGKVSHLVAGFLAGYGLLALTAASVILRRPVGRAAMVLGAIASLTMLPLHMLAFASVWKLGLPGVLFCLFSASRLLRAPRDAVDDRPAAGSRGAVEAAGDEFAVLTLFATVCMLFAILLIDGYGLASTTLASLSAWGVIVIALGLSLLFEVTHYLPGRRHGPYLPWLLLAAAALCSLTGGDRLVLPTLAVRQILVAARAGFDRAGGHNLWYYLTDRPANLLVATFASAIFLGTILLTLPRASRLAGGLPFIDAFFTAASATCVTGLTVLDTGRDFTLFGQILILTMIQVGGLGIMTLSTFLALLLGRNVGLRGEFAVREMIGEGRSRTALRLVQFIVAFTFVVELIGASVLAPLFHSHGLPWRRSLYYAVFHSVSAFCNAGFGLEGRNLEGMAGTPGILIAISLLIILGGLGFGVLFALFRFGRQQGLGGSHVRLVVLTSLALCVLGTVLLWAIERPRAWAMMTPGQSVLHAWFQSVSARTAGFNSVPLAALSAPSHLILMILMFIGVAPGSTGGGIKVTTLVVLLVVVRAVIRGGDPVFAGRRFAPGTVLNAVALVTIAAFLVLAVGTFLLVTQPSLGAEALCFEAVSAFGTVGMSLGCTAQLSAFGKIGIILLMFIGRVGPLALLMMVRPAAKSRVDYPAENIMIG